MSTPDNSPVLALTLTPLQVEELRPLLKAAYLSSGAVFGEIRRTVGGDAELLLGVQSTDRSRLLRQILTAGTGAALRLTTPKPKKETP